ncbi:conserved hypothetical protein [Pediculus humanus corporis]|uniref:Small lysine-rich protein 1 n=1 Tax=Pediculus humanus subsp. corporis TaxID=121224 RepID=E0VPQ0_PEDHC|nr:uncharacterized protein Phum_PHUM362780 [Pediculus humanus corporis]EEB15356.1 conserved hypothetical protein [Pediculus humanus corporis]
MGGKKNKKKNTNNKSGSKEKNGKKTKIKKSEGKVKFNKSRINVDIFTDTCMENAYYICHNVQDVLKYRGFPWPDAASKKKKGKK